MKCPSCGTVIATLPQNRAVRCLTCGKLLDPSSRREQAPPATPILRHSYTPPYGKLLAQMQKSGDWMAVSYIAVPQSRKPVATTLLTNLLSSWRELNHPALAKLHSFDDKELRCTWVLPKVTHAAPLAASRPALRPVQVKSLIGALAAQLEILHSAGLAAFDLSPSVIFLPSDVEQVRFIPTPWLASQAIWRPGGVKDMPFAAPELDEASQTYPDPMRADLYALGELTWFLLTGKERKKSPAMLPSEHAAELLPWDRFIDGCCRTNPARRFDSIASALRALEEGQESYRNTIPVSSVAPSVECITAKANPVPSQTPQDASFRPASSSMPRRRNRRKLVWAAGLIVVTVLAVGAYLRREQLAPIFPFASDLLAPYQRGFGDTILSYADRSYENSSWKKLQESDSLEEIGRIDTSSGNEIFLWSVVGWDEETFWVTEGIRLHGRVFRYQNGHWSLQAKLEYVDQPMARPLNSDTLLVATRYDLRHEKRKAFVLSPRGVTNYGELYGCAEICPIAPDLVYFFRVRNFFPSLKVANGEATFMESKKYKEAFVHRENNTPLKEYEVSNIRLTRTFAPGVAIGIAPPTLHRDFKIVSFKNGIWYAIGEIPRKDLYDAWLYGTGSPSYLTIVGKEGFVLVHKINGSNLELPLPPVLENTSLHLLKVWGVSPDKFWIMDTNGTVWERKGTDWRVVVRGLHRDDVHFHSAWVSPKGTVIAITAKHVYRLD